jgi:glycosyltransferase involved in cell wall biosynthesis
VTAAQESGSTQPDGALAPEIARDVIVVVPTHNSEQTLESCLRSILGRTCLLTFVVVGNHSIDSSRAIANRYAHHVLIAGPERYRQRNLGPGTHRRLH